MAKKATKAMVEAAPVADGLPVVPIWRDFFYDTASAVPVDYTLRINGKVAYSGHAVPRPDATAKVRLNGIVANYLGQMLPIVTNSGKGATALVEMDCGNTGVFSKVATFLYDWSYTDGRKPEEGLMSERIDNRISYKQNLYFSFYGNQRYPIAIYLKDGRVSRNEVAGTLAEVTNGRVVNLTEDVVRITVGSALDIEVTDGCDEFALHYVNAYGGWDSLLIPRGKRTDTINRHTYRKVYDNRLATDAGAVDYANEVTRKYQLHTALLSGEAGKRMHHLLESPLVYLQDLKDGSLYPVIITDTECEEKSFKSEGGHLFKYTIGVEVARDYKRK